MRAHGEAIEADLAFRGIDVRDVWRPGRHLTFRRLAVLIRNLPPESATMTALRVAEYDNGPTTRRSKEAPDAPVRSPWSRVELLLAELIDRVAHLAWLTARINGGKGKAPDPLVRPGVKVKGAKRKKKAKLTQEQADFLYAALRGEQVDAAELTGSSGTKERGSPWRPSV